MPADHPVIRIEISGIRGAGKSVLASYFRGLLADFSIPRNGPAGLPHRNASELGAAIVHLQARGLSVEFVETQTGIPAQVDARMRRRRPLRGDAARALIMERGR
jgi:hypothetical protein